MSKKSLVIGIDASAIKAGGGLTHLSMILKYASPEKFGIKKVIVWGGKQLEKLPDRKWLIKKPQGYLKRSLLHEIYWKLFILPKISKNNVNLIFCPAGSYPGKSVPYVSMSQNMLVFEREERNRFPSFIERLRYIILNLMQSKSFSESTGIIFISEYAKSYISGKIMSLKGKPSIVVYHGVSNDFRKEPKKQLPIEQYSFKNPFKILYVSIINFYKHQWNVVNAIKNLRQKGFPIELHLVGPAHPQALIRLEKSMSGCGDYVTFHGVVPYEEISSFYKNADGFLFASTCENMPNILVEAMSSGLPILCSSYGPMPEILKSGGMYFDPLEINSIESSIESFLLNFKKREEFADKSYMYSTQFDWEKCANETFKFLSSCLRNGITNN